MSSTNIKIADHLAKNIFDAPEMVPNRNGYGEGLLEVGRENAQVVALCGDLTESTRTHLFKEEFPERFVEVGVAEQNMASVASGMAAMGKIPFIASYAMFSPGRSWEQVRTTICYNDANVKIIGAHAGVSVGPDGATHQAIEDIAITRVIPRMTVIAPCDVHEARKAVRAAAEHTGPVYIRLAREKTAVVTGNDSPFTIGKAEVYLTRDTRHEKSVGIIATGTIMHNALVAAKTLNENGVGASLMNLATIKPLDTDALDAFAEEHDIIVTVEEHQAAGGMGSAVAEYYAEKETPKRVVRIGINDEFGQSGEPEELIAHYGLDARSITERIMELI